MQLNKNQVVWSILGDIKTFNGVLSDAGLSFFFLTYEGLVQENPLTGIKEPLLAESWKISDDKRNIVFTLREGLKWSDGQALSADDVVFTYNQIYLNKKIPNKYQDSFRVGRKGSFPILTKVNEREIKFTITEPFAPFIDSLQAPILPKHILKETIEKTDENNNPKFLTTWGTNTSPEEIIVNGPYKLKEYVVGERVIFDKNPYYWQKDEQGNQLPNIDKIIWVFIDSLDTSFLQFRSGSLDTFWVNPEYFSLLKQEEKRGNFTIYNGGVNYGTRFLAFNLNQGSRKGKPLVNPIKSQWFNNINFRKAIAYGIDRERMINNIYRGLGATLNTQISVQSPY